MGDAGTCVPKAATHRVCSTTSPELATSPHSRNTCKGDVGHLVSIAYLHMAIWFDADEGEDNVISALRHKDRVREIFVEPASVPRTSQCELHLAS